MCVISLSPENVHYRLHACNHLSPEFKVGAGFVIVINFISPFSLCRRCDSMEKLRKKCDNLEKEIKDQWKFKEFYQFTFTFAKNPGQKGLGRWSIVLQ